MPRMQIMPGGNSRFTGEYDIVYPPTGNCNATDFPTMWEVDETIKAALDAKDVALDGKVDAKILASEKKLTERVDAVTNVLTSAVIEQLKSQIKSELRKELVDSGCLKAAK